MAVSYIARTRDHLLMLDDDGVCLYVHRRNRNADGDDAVDGAIRCIGAQYVAALDVQEPGVLAHEPVLGSPMLFAKVGEGGRISVVRTGPIECFEARGSGVFETTPTVPVPYPSSPSIEFLSDDCVEELDPETTMRFRRPAHTRGPTRLRTSRSRIG